MMADCTFLWGTFRFLSQIQEETFPEVQPQNHRNQKLPKPSRYIEVPWCTPIQMSFEAKHPKSGLHI